jgi:hypothetical protein
MYHYFVGGKYECMLYLAGAEGTRGVGPGYGALSRRPCPKEPQELVPFRAGG